MTNPIETPLRVGRFESYWRCEEVGGREFAPANKEEISGRGRVVSRWVSKWNGAWLTSRLWLRLASWSSKRGWVGRGVRNTKDWGWRRNDFKGTWGLGKVCSHVRRLWSCTMSLEWVPLGARQPHYALPENRHVDVVEDPLAARQ